jgi:putative salt-induced outer membrane protein
MKVAGFFVAISVAFASMSAVYAEEKKWTDEAELSFVNTGGNTEVVSLSGKNRLTYAFTGKLLGAWKLGALYGETDTVKNAEKYYTEFRSDYSYTDKIYFLAIGGWLQDKFAGIESRYYLGPGVGYKFLTGPKHFLVGEGGLNYVSEEYITDTEEDFPQGRVYGLYQYAFSEKNKFSQSLELLYAFDDSDNYNVNSETALITALSDYFSLKTSYEIRYDHEPVPATLEKTDTVLSVTLVVNF